MSVARSVAEVLRDHVRLEVEAIDRMYLNVYVPHLQSVGSVVGYLRVHRGQRFASTTAVTPMTEAFVRNIDQFVNAAGVDLVAFQKGQRKDDVTQKYLGRFTQHEGVLYVGKAQEKARVMRTERRRSRFTGGTYPWIVESTAMVNHYYFYCVDEDFGPFFLKFCSYFPYNAKLCINGNEYLKRQLAKRGVAFEALERAALVARSAVNGISFTPARNTLPASVSSAPWARRWNSAAPTSASKSLICWLSGGCPIPTLAAALVKCLSSATARKYRMWRSSIVISKTDHKACSIYWTNEARRSRSWGKDNSSERTSSNGVARVKTGGAYDYRSRRPKNLQGSRARRRRGFFRACRR
jgi:hypothetical protein